ncbi:MAG: B12-binding domain-containing radical SAM protein [Acidobacteria bacterium]|nr:B12-binding domain-containing radical SAM protein [Acidobacteriota bacterium]
MSGRTPACDAFGVGAPLRILLVSPRGPLYRHRTGIWKKSLRYQPLTLTTLASLVPSDVPAEVTLVDEGIHELPAHVDADLVGISAITGTAPRSYELADRLRRDGIPVVLGGVHPTLVPEEAQVHADALVVGYAEETWPRLLRDFVRGEMRPRYDEGPSLSLANLPFPRRDLLPASLYTVAHTLEATRGCTHKCAFCVVPSAWGRPRQKPVAEVVADIVQMNARRLLFLDLNIIADVDYAKELFRALIPLKVTWGGLATSFLAEDDELLGLAAKSGCRGILVGFESLREGSLKETRKGWGARHGYREILRKLHAHRIAVQGCFVFGFDHDDEAVFEETAEFALETAIDLPRFAILTPFPGTPLFSKLKEEGRLLTEDWSYYDGQHVVFRPAQMTPEALRAGTERAWKKAYSYSGVARRLLASRLQLPVSLAANLGYRFYAHNLSRFYNCREALL